MPAGFFMSWQCVKIGLLCEQGVDRNRSNANQGSNAMLSVVFFKATSELPDMFKQNKTIMFLKGSQKRILRHRYDIWKLWNCVFSGDADDNLAIWAESNSKFCRKSYEFALRWKAIGIVQFIKCCKRWTFTAYGLAKIKIALKCSSNSFLTIWNFKIVQATRSTANFNRCTSLILFLDFLRKKLCGFWLCDEESIKKIKRRDIVSKTET